MSFFLNVLALFCTNMNDINRFMSLIKEHGNCSVKSMRELKTIIKDKTGINIESLEVSINRCMKQQFKTCGYEGKQIPNEKGQVDKEPQEVETPDDSNMQE